MSVRTTGSWMGAALICASVHSHAQVTTNPSFPKAQESVRVVVPEVFNDQASANQTAYNTVDGRSTLVTMSGNSITVSLLMARSDFPSPPSAAIDIPLGQFPAGSYQVLVTRREPNGAPLGNVGLTPFNVAARTSSDPLWNHTDLWWNPSESGWGLNLMQHGSGKIFATWFVYGPDHAATWFVVPDGAWISPTEYRGSIYKTTGPYFGDCTTAACPTPFEPANVHSEVVGEASFNFHPTLTDSMGAVFTIGGKTISKVLQRQSF